MPITAQRIARLEGHAGALYAIANGRGNDLLFSAGADRVVAEWSLQAAASQPFAIRTEASVYSLCHLHDQQLLAIGRSDGGLHLIDLAQRQEVKYFTLHSAGLYALLPLNEGQQLLAASGDGTLSLWDSSSYELLRHIPLSTEKLRDVALSPDGKLLAAAAGDGVVYVLELESWQLVGKLKGHIKGVSSVAFHPNGRWLTSGGKDAHLRFWLLEDNFRLVRSIPAHNYAIYGIAFSPDGSVCATASRDKTVKLWDPASFDQPLRLDVKSHRGHKHSVNALLWKNATTLISASDDRTMAAWNIQTAPAL